ncbi:hypothetical protein AF332_12445 [Sporosarcina globispora]|uniref:YojE n=1 Tax=Sporosarcina globispora TaxID=1459 RepID=A0A0M0GCI7_SPOGL|nr:hypothetical protein [Sporosarcina globispora]KON87559.1 hypothetical protein AF332_12445 [Sporosarcina globispora]
MSPDYEKLLNEYRKLWNNRKLEEDNNAEPILKEAISRELKDENSHPRVRKTIYEKFFLAVKRITHSDLDESSKNALIEMHINELEILK